MSRCWPPLVPRSLIAYSSPVYTVQTKQGHQCEPATCWEKVFTCCSADPPSCPTEVPQSFLLSSQMPRRLFPETTGCLVPLPALLMMSETHGRRTLKWTRSAHMSPWPVSVTNPAAHLISRQQKAVDGPSRSFIKRRSSPHSAQAQDGSGHG